MGTAPFSALASTPCGGDCRSSPADLQHSISPHIVNVMPINIIIIIIVGSSSSLEQGNGKQGKAVFSPSRRPYLRVVAIHPDVAVRSLCLAGRAALGPAVLHVPCAPGHHLFTIKLCICLCMTGGCVAGGAATAAIACCFCRCFSI